MKTSFTVFFLARRSWLYIKRNLDSGALRVIRYQYDGQVYTLECIKETR